MWCHVKNFIYMQCVRVTKNRFGSVQIHCRVVVGECNDRDGVWVRGNCGNGFGGRELRRKLGSFGDFVVGDSGAVWVAGVLSGRGDSGAGLGSWLAVIRPLGTGICGENWVRSVNLLWSGAKRRRDGVGPRKVRFGTGMVNTYGSTAGPRVVQ